MALARTSFLEAVNRVLQMLGEAPVNSLQGQFGLAKQAEDALTDVSRRVQAEGWSFNTDYEVTLTRNTNDEIAVGSNVSRVVVDPLTYPDYDVIQRGSRIIVASNLNGTTRHICLCHSQLRENDETSGEEKSHIESIMEH